MQRALMSCSIGKSTQLTCFLCRVNTYWQSVLALAMDRLIRVSMKNAASCVIYHEFGEVLNAQRRWVFPSARLAQGCLISESVESSLNESSVILTTLRRAVTPFKYLYGATCLLYGDMKDIKSIYLWMPTYEI
uniref:Secreted protein n=1 Tax=Heterorhabditis bacteriophora TaxID=37862 RepID=A0A1I7WKP8_HETBA